MNSWTQNCRKSPNFEISEGVPIKTRVPREVIMVIMVIAIPRFLSEKNNTFSKRTRLLLNLNAFTLIFSLIYISLKQGYLFSEPIYYML